MSYYCNLFWASSDIIYTRVIDRTKNQSLETIFWILNLIFRMSLGLLGRFLFILFFPFKNTIKCFILEKTRPLLQKKLDDKN